MAAAPRAATSTSTTPRLLLFRHAETEWTLTGQHTSITDVPLTENGRTATSAAALSLVGRNRCLDPTRLKRIIISPRLRARETFSLLLPTPPVDAAVDDRVQEWRYGEYEGLTSHQIHETNPGWDIWSHGAPGGESPEDVEARADEVIGEVREMHREACKGGWADKADVLVVSHGHFARAFVKRWMGVHVGDKMGLVLEPGGWAVLSYEHRSVDEPALVLGGGVGH